MTIAILPATDHLGQSHIDDAFKRALIGYGIARGLNGVISVAQGTEVAIQPAGVGVNFAPGEILDPVNDLVERFSWIMMLASSSLGVQKVLLAMSGWNGLALAVFAVGLLYALSLVYGRWQSLKPVLQRLFLFVLLLRFLMPVVSVANDWAYRTFLESDYQAASKSLELATTTIGEINSGVLDDGVENPGNLIDQARALYDRTLDRVDVEKRLQQYREAAESISENTIQLVVVFLMQTLVFPIAFLLILIGVLKRLVKF